jgi:hypothetical protein
MTVDEVLDEAMKHPGVKFPKGSFTTIELRHRIIERSLPLVVKTVDRTIYVVNTERIVGLKTGAS